ncbi:penicillin-binding protein 2 [Pelomicrobium sp. G1]|uniref:penicillin-binding protein 2 n=1 Tax=unclassified Pelomicrobium TaxID=2815318 RepID=UPI000B2D41C9
MNRRVELKNTEREVHAFRLRLAAAGFLVLAAFAVLAARFFYLQVVQREHYQTLAEANRISLVPIVPNRGLILDRNGEVLASNFSAYTLEITPAKVRDLDALIDELSTVVEIAPRDRRRFQRLLEEAKSFESLPIRTRLSDEEAARFAANRFRFPNVELRARLFRQYPWGETASHVVGYIGRISDRDIETLKEQGSYANYRGSDYIGRVGIERSYEEELHGVTGVEQVEVDASGRALRTLARTPPVAGNTLTLALDIRLQEVAEQAFGERRGALVAIEPATGGILALVSKPGFDPNLFVEGIDPQNWKALNESPERPLNNRALRGQYPPGSTFKPFMALAGLELGKRTPSYTISDPGWFSLPGHNHRYRDWKPGGHGLVDLRKSLVVSCDTYYYGLAVDLGIDAIHAFMRKFGFGQKTGVDIEGELPGLLPSQEWKRKRLRDKWYVGDTVSVGIGQGYMLATPMQLAQATAILANGGTAFRPHLVQSIEDAATGEVRRIAAEPLYTLKLDPNHLRLVQEALVDVTRPGGTAARAGAGAPYEFAGKTGTAQVVAMKQGEKYDEKKLREEHRDHALFVAYAPAEAPRIALAILVENGGAGSATAAPIARVVFDYYLLGKRPSPGPLQGEPTNEPND